MSTEVPLSARLHDGLRSAGRRAANGRLGYTGRARRTLRALDRSTRALTSPATHPSAAVVNCFWWEQVKNFGDLITPLLLCDLGIVPRLTSAASADLLGVGSLVQHVEDDWAGTIWGAGMVADTPRYMPGAVTLALRGELTRDRLGNPPVEALGDPGLLLDTLVSRRSVRYDVGLVPHYVHAGDPALARLLDSYDGLATVIDVQRSPQAVVSQIIACRVIVSTSMHGVITADSFGIPAVWLRMPRALAGGDFKFHDHESVVRPSRPRGFDVAHIESMDEAIARASTADAAAVSRAKEALKRAGRRILDVTPSYEASATSAAWAAFEGSLRG